MVPVVQDAIRKTMVSAKNEAAKMGFTPPKNPFVTNADGRLTLGQSEDGKRILPGLQFWDYVKRNLDAVGTRQLAELGIAGGTTCMRVAGEGRKTLRSS